MPRILLLSESFDSPRCRCIIPAIIAGAATVGSAFAGAASARHSQDAANKINREYAEKNYQLQAQELAYQHALQQQIFQREDTAYQRTVNDMRRAGMSPLAMSGTNNAGEAVSTTAPQYNYEHKTDSTSAQILSQMIPQAISSVSNIASLKGQNAQNELVSEQARKLRIENDYNETHYADSQDQASEILAEQLKELRDSNKFQDATYQQRVEMIKAELKSVQNSYKISDSQIKQMARDLNYQETYGIVDDMSDTEKLIHLIAPLLGVDLGRGTADSPFKNLDQITTEMGHSLYELISGFRGSGSREDSSSRSSPSTFSHIVEYLKWRLFGGH